MSEEELAKLPTPEWDDTRFETSVNGAGQAVYRVIIVSEWAIIPSL